MLAKLTSKNQLTLPKAVAGTFPGVEYFDVSVTNGCIVLAPVEIHKAGAVRAKLAELNMSESDVREAVEWARGRGP
jgi:hypothetical protein